MIGHIGVVFYMQFRMFNHWNKMLLKRDYTGNYNNIFLEHVEPEI